MGLRYFSAISRRSSLETNRDSELPARDEQDDIVQGIVLMRRGQQSLPTIRRVEAEVEKIKLSRRLVLDRKKLAAFSAAAGRFLLFPIGDRRCNRTRASVGNAGGNARPSLTNATLAASRLLHRRSPTAPCSKRCIGRPPKKVGRIFGPRRGTAAPSVVHIFANDLAVSIDERHSPLRFIAAERLRGRVKRRARGGLGRVGFLLSTFHVVSGWRLPPCAARVKKAGGATACSCVQKPPRIRLTQVR